MRTDPRAVDLGASRARLERACEGGQGWAWVSVDDLLALLLVQEAQAARLAAGELVLAAAEAWVDGLGAYGQTKERWDALIYAVREYRQRIAWASGLAAMR